MGGLQRIDLETSPARTPGSSPGLHRTAVLPSAAQRTHQLGVAIVSTDPDARTGVHHHGPYETAVYVLDGTVRFHCGVGLAQHVDGQPGAFMFIRPYAVHVEHNPAPTGDNRMIVVRDTHGVALFPCEVPMDTPDGQTGVTMVPRAVADHARSGWSEAFTGISLEAVGARRIALERHSLPPGGTYTSAAPADGEAAVAVLAGTVELGDEAGNVLSSAAGEWWYVPPGTRWTVRNVADAPAELLAVRCTLAPLESLPLVASAVPAD